MEIRATLRQLRLCRPELARDLERWNLDHLDAERPEVELVPTRAGDPTIRCGERFLHSSVDPRREARRLSEGLTHGASEGELPDLVLCFGVGLGYLIEEMRRAHPSLPLVAIVSDDRLLAVALRHREARWWCRYGPDRIVPYEDGHTIREEIQRHGSVTPRLVSSTGFRIAFPDRWRNVHDIVDTVVEREQVNRNTLRRFGRRWVRNTIHSLMRHGVLPGIDGLEGIAHDLPALVLGAGPTLDEVLPKINTFLEKTLVIAVDTAVAALARFGVEADIAVVADPQYWNTRHIDRYPPRTTLLVAESATYPRVLRLWNEYRLVSASLFPLGGFIDRYAGRSLRLGAGGSVATSAWDLAFPDRRTHCADSFFENRLFTIADRLNPAEHGLTRYLHGGVPTEVERTDGGVVTSDQRMAVYRSWFTEQTKRHRDTRTTVLSDRGSHVQGFFYQPPTEFLRRLQRCSQRKTEVLDRIRRRAEEDASRRTDSESIVRALDESFRRIEERAEAAIRHCARLERDAADDPAVLRDLDRIDRSLLSANEGEIAGFIAAETVATVAERKAGSVAESIRQASEIYAALRRSCTFHRDIIDRYR